MIPILCSESKKITILHDHVLSDSLYTWKRWVTGLNQSETLSCIIDNISRDIIDFKQYQIKIDIATEMNRNQILRNTMLIFSKESLNSQWYKEILIDKEGCVSAFLFCLISCGAWVWEEFSNHVLLVPRDPGHHQLDRRQRGSELEDDFVTTGCMDNCLPGCNKGHSVFWEGEADLLLHEIMKWEPTELRNINFQIAQRHNMQMLRYLAHLNNYTITMRNYDYILSGTFAFSLKLIQGVIVLQLLQTQILWKNTHLPAV